ncbi:MAG TPA: hypothetical protein VJU77_11470 [Chthoniobacterales bacterium]|nr:hypothetical protein [Chthoniobacterales bacterium]
MKKRSASRSAFFSPRVLMTCCAIGVLLVLLAFALDPGGTARAQGSQQNQQTGQARPLTPEEARGLVAALKPLLNQSSKACNSASNAFVILLTCISGVSLRR